METFFFFLSALCKTVGKILRDRYRRSQSSVPIANPLAAVTNDHSQWLSLCLYYRNGSGDQKLKPFLTGLKSRCWQTCVLAESSRGEPVFLFFPDSGVCLHFLARGPFLHTESQQHSISPLCPRLPYVSCP